MLMQTLMFALKRKRPHGGYGEEELAQYVEAIFDGLTFRDGAQNVHLDLRGGGSRTLFVAHLDTVHRVDGGNRIKRKGDFLYATPGSVLGADDGAGVAMLCHLAIKGVPGYYIFTRGEEVGGVGATFLADHYEDLLSKFDRAIAFDRKGTDSIITSQWSGTCASDEFAEALAAQLTTETMWYLADDTGVYTDTAEFTGFIPECTNISVGYRNEHTAREQLDLTHYRNLAKAALDCDWEGLPVVRDPAKEAEERRMFVYGTRYMGGGKSWDTHSTDSTPWKTTTVDSSPWKTSWKPEWEGTEWDDPLMPTEGKLANGFAFETFPSEDGDTLNSTPDRWNMLDALDAAELGDFDPIRELIAQAIYPEDIVLARYSVRDLKVPESVIDEAFDRVDVDTPHNLALWIYEECTAHA